MTNSDLSEALLGATRRFTKAGFAQAQSIASGDLSRPEWHLLWLLQQWPDPEGARPSEIAKQQRVTAGSVAQHLKSLERQELVKRTADATDRRVVLVTLTPKGVERFHQARSQIINSFDAIVTALGEEDSKTLTALLTRATEIMEITEPKQC